MERQQESPTTIQNKNQEEGLSSVLNSKVDQVTGIEKSLLDDLLQHTHSVLDSTRSIFPMLPAAFFDKAERSIEQFVGEQSSLLDLLAKETHEYLDATSQRSPEFAEDTSVVIGETTDIVATKQEKAMDIALSGFEGDSG